ncbi:hypothetical protein BM527_16565 [Alteromonas sp. Mex14]|nr:hypothetical protein BM527_16565 [Alteromonas sp. Mex14]
MISLLKPNTLSSWANSILEQLEGIFFDNRTEADVESKAFYVYRPYPSSLKSSQLEDWVALQSRTLSPFSDGDVYTYMGKKGLCFWATQALFDGVPETASHSSLDDGTHWVKGKKYFYKETWKQGELVGLLRAEVAPDNEEVIDIESLFSSAWARHRKVDKVIKEPFTWGIVVAILSAFWLSINSGKWVGVQQQLENYGSQITTLEDRLSDKLALQTQYQTQVSLIGGINRWQDETGSLPHVMASVVQPVISQSKWNADAIAWQSRALEVELISDALDITQLISELEQRPEFAEVAIRPNASSNTWNLQARLNDAQ